MLRAAYDAIQAPTKQGRPLRVYYGTQVGNEPPTFVIFVNEVELVHFSYQRYLESQFRARFPFIGTPIRLIFRESDRKSESN